MTATPSGGTACSLTAYDALGRERRKYVPVPGSGLDCMAESAVISAGYGFHHDNTCYTESHYDALDRVTAVSDLEKQLKSKGYSRKDIKSYVVEGKSSGNGRKPVDWFDSVLLANMEELGAIAQEYYEDYSMEKLDEMVRRMTIRKETGRSS